MIAYLCVFAGLCGVAVFMRKRAVGGAGPYKNNRKE